MESLPNNLDIHRYVESLAPGTCVVWIPNGTLGTVQADKSIVWDDGHHLTRRQMTDNHALLIFSRDDKDKMRAASLSHMNCMPSGCELRRWDPAKCKEQALESVCPLAVLSDPDPHGIEPLRRSKARAVRTKPAIPA